MAVSVRQYFSFLILFFLIAASVIAQPKHSLEPTFGLIPGMAATQARVALTHSGEEMIFVADTVIALESYGLARSTYSYNSFGECVSTQNDYSYSGPYWTPQYKYSFQYDSVRRVVYELIERWISPAWVPEYRYSLVYGVHPGEQSTVNEQWNDSVWQTYSISSNKTDPHGNPLFRLVQSFSNNILRSTDQTLYTYTPSGKPLSVVLTRRTNNVVREADTTSYMYDEFDRLIQKISNTNDGVTNRTSHIETTTYTLEGKQKELGFDDWEDGRNTQTLRYVYDYSLGEKVTIRTSQYRIQQNWKNEYRTTDILDDAGRTILSTEDTWEDGEWTPSGRISYAYDESGRRILVKNENLFHGSIESSSSTITRYDSEGNILIRVYESKSFLGSLVSDRTTNTYNADGSRLTTLVQSLRNGSWFNNWEENLVYDEYGNVIHYERYSRTQAGDWQPESGTLYVKDSAGNSNSFGGRSVSIHWSRIAVQPSAHLQTPPGGYMLYANYPNPFNPVTTVRYAVPFDSYIRLVVCNVLGQELQTLVDGFQASGEKEVVFNATGLASGVYFYNLQARDATYPGIHFERTRKMMLVR